MTDRATDRPRAHRCAPRTPAQDSIPTRRSSGLALAVGLLLGLGSFAGLLPAEQPPRGPRLMVQTDRTTYEAGHTMRLRGIVRAPRSPLRRNDAVQLPAVHTRVRLSLKRGGRTLFEQILVARDPGAFGASFRLPEAAIDATYRLEVACAGLIWSQPLEVLGHRWPAHASVWLRDRQLADGGWPAGSAKIGGQPLDRVGQTGLALLGYLRDRQTHRSGPFQHSFRRGLRFLSARQDPAGSLSEGDYNQALATLALLESYRETKSPLVARMARRAWRNLESRQSADGSWSSAIAPTAWATLCLASARAADLPWSQQRARRLRAFVDRQTAGARPITTRAEVAAGLVSLLFLKVDRDDPRVRRAADWLVGRPIRWRSGQELVWYLSTLAAWG